MSKNYSLGQRYVAYILLFSFLLQSCYNPSIPNTPVDKEKIQLGASVAYDKDIDKQEETMAVVLESSQTLIGKKLQKEAESLASLADTSGVELASSKTILKDKSLQLEKKHRTSQGARTSQPQTRSIHINSTREQSSRAISTRKPAVDALQVQQQLSSSQRTSNSQRKEPLTSPELALVSIKGKPKDSSSAIEKSTFTTSYISQEFNKLSITKDRYKLEFQQLPSGQWQALVEESFQAGIMRNNLVPVYFKEGYNMVQLAEHNLAWQKGHIHICLPKNTSHEQGYVYIGDRGLKGGMDDENVGRGDLGKKEKSEQKEQDQEEEIDNLPISQEPRNTIGSPQEAYPIDGKTFRRQDVSGRGMRCFFNAAGLDAREQIRKLKENQNIRLVRYMIANEIVSAAENPNQLSPKIKEAIGYTLYESQRHAANQLEEKRSKLLKEQNEDPNEQNIQALPSVLQNTRKRDHEILEDLRKRASSLEAFNIFVEDHIGGENMMVALQDVQGDYVGGNPYANCTSIDAIAYINKLGIKIYQPTTNGELRLAHQFIPENATKIVYLYHSNLHFQALVIGNEPDSSSSVDLSGIDGNGYKRTPSKVKSASHQPTVKEEEVDDNSAIQASNQQEAFSNLVKIGEGSFGEVFKGIWKKRLANSIYVAIKALKDSNNIGELSKETAIMKDLMHKNIVRFFGVHDIKIGNKIVTAIITELMNGGSVEGFLKKASNSSIKPMDILSMALDAARGIRYLHENDIIHRDLAARNLLLTTLINGKYLVKVSDFGLSKRIPADEADVFTYLLSLDPSEKNPIRWTAPEVLINKNVSRRSDLWSFGVVLYELFTLCKVPYEDYSNNAIIKKIKSGEKMYTYLGIPDCPEGTQELLNSCMDNNPKARPKFDKIISKLDEIQEREKGNNTWKLEEGNNAAISVDLGYDKSTDGSRGQIEEKENKDADQTAAQAPAGDYYSINDPAKELEDAKKAIHNPKATKEFDQGFRKLEALAKEGYPEAQHILGYQYKMADKNKDIRNYLISRKILLQGDSERELKKACLLKAIYWYKLELADKQKNKLVTKDDLSSLGKLCEEYGDTFQGQEGLKYYEEAINYYQEATELGSTSADKSIKAVKKKLAELK